MEAVFLFVKFSTVAEVINSKLNLITNENELNISSPQNGILLITSNLKIVYCTRNISVIILDIF